MKAKQLQVSVKNLCLQKCKRVVWSELFWSAVFGMFFTSACPPLEKVVHCKLRVSELNSWRPLYNEFCVSVLLCTPQSYMHCNYLVVRANVGICSCREPTAYRQFRKSNANSEGKNVPSFILILNLISLTNSCNYLQNHALIKSWPNPYYF